jgi:hypothetical protein
VSVGDGAWTIELMTGYLERGDGRQLDREVANDLDPNVAAPVRAQTSSELKSGVIPDFRVAAPRARAGGLGVPSPAPGDTGQAPNLGTDPVVQEAIRVLRRSLAKFI